VADQNGVQKVGSLPHLDHHEVSVHMKPHYFLDFSSPFEASLSLQPSQLNEHSYFWLCFQEAITFLQHPQKLEKG
jgi:hypothetical protein